MASWASLGASLNGSHGEEPTGKDWLSLEVMVSKKGGVGSGGVSTSETITVTSPKELTFTVKPRGSSQLLRQRRDTMMSGKVAEMSFHFR